MEQMERLAEEYSETRRNNPPGDFRTALMTEIMSRMRGLAPRLPEASVLTWLKDPDHARRLAAYAFLYARPDFTQVDALIDSVANRHNPPFAQYWGIMALQKVIGARVQAVVSNHT